MDDILKTMGKRAFGGEQSSGKRSMSPTGGPAPKKPLAPTNGPFTGQPPPAGNPPLASANGPSKGHQPPAATPPLEKTPSQPRIPAIFLDDSVDWATHGKKLEDLGGEGYTAVCRAKAYRLKATTVVGFRALQRYLYSNKLPFYTFNLGRRRSLKVVISGLPTGTTEVALHDALLEEGFGVEDVARLTTYRGPTRSWLVTMLDDREREVEHTKPAAGIYRLHRLLHVSVEVTAYRRPKGPPQCHRCQHFGHGSSNCGRPWRCVRCGGAHSRNKCEKPAGEKGTCCNCGEDHNASYKGCPYFKKLRAAARGSTEKRLYSSTAVATESSSKRLVAPQDEDEPEKSDDSEGFVKVSRKRKRAPRNPANRQARPPKPAEPSAPKRPTPSPRTTPRQRLDWPPKPAPTPAVQSPAGSEEANAEEMPQPAPTTPNVEDVAAVLADVIRQLTTLAGMLTQLLPSLRRE